MKLRTLKRRTWLHGWNRAVFLAGYKTYVRSLHGREGMIAFANGQ